MSKSYYIYNFWNNLFFSKTKCHSCSHFQIVYIKKGLMRAKFPHSLRKCLIVGCWTVVDVPVQGLGSNLV